MKKSTCVVLISTDLVTTGLNVPNLSPSSKVTSCHFYDDIIVDFLDTQ